MFQHDKNVPRKGQVVAHWGPRKEPRELSARFVALDDPVQYESYQIALGDRN